MSEIGVFTPEQARALWQDYQRRRGMPTDSNVSRGPRPMGTQPPITVILDAALDVATDSKTGATSCLATRLAYSVVDNEYSETDQQVTVWNHSEYVAHEPNTFGQAHWIDGHWIFYGDCGPMASGSSSSSS